MMGEMKMVIIIGAMIVKEEIVEDLIIWVSIVKQMIILIESDWMNIDLIESEKGEMYFYSNGSDVVNLVVLGYINLQELDLILLV